MRAMFLPPYASLDTAFVHANCAAFHILSTPWQHRTNVDCANLQRPAILNAIPKKLREREITMLQPASKSDHK